MDETGLGHSHLLVMRLCSGVPEMRNSGPGHGAVERSSHVVLVTAEVGIHLPTDPHKGHGGLLEGQGET